MWFIVEKSIIITTWLTIEDDIWNLFWDSINNLVHDFTNSIANPLELLPSCTEPLICSQFHPGCGALGIMAG